MKISYPLLALAIGAFGIGMTELSPMDLLPVTMHGVDVSIPVAGMLTSVYAIGVMVGVPLMMLLLFHRARRSTSIFLMAIFMLGNVSSVVAPDYMALMLLRILTNLNRGAFFGLNSVVAASVVPERKQASAVTTMSMGLALVDIGGVSAATWLGETTGWWIPFLAAAGPSVISMAGLFPSSPKGGAGARPEMKKELAVSARPQVLSALLTTVLGAGTMFTLCTYISSVLQSITHVTPMFVTAMLVLIGVGFSIGNYLGGKLADRSVNGTLKGFLLLLMMIMLAIPFPVHNEFDTATSMVMWGAITFVVAPPLQMRVMRVASRALGLSSSVNIGAFDPGNALGIAAGGAVISTGLGYNSVSVMRAIVAGLTLLLVFISTRRQPEAVYAVDN